MHNQVSNGIDSEHVDGWASKAAEARELFMWSDLDLTPSPQVSSQR